MVLSGSKKKLSYFFYIIYYSSIAHKDGNTRKDKDLESYVKSSHYFVLSFFSTLFSSPYIALDVNSWCSEHAFTF